MATAGLPSCGLTDVSLGVVREAFRGVQRYHLLYWDAVIWATARLAQIPVVLSEDFADGSELDGLTFLNPFSEDFQLHNI